MNELDANLDKVTAHLEPPLEKKSVFSILQKRYPPNEYALMKEVRDMAGYSASRSADYIAVNLWPSRGLTVEGIELKRSRGDWLSELKKPEKAENIFQHCDYFWLLTADDSIAKIEEIPPTWGWLSIKGERIFVKKEAPSLKPIPLTRNFLCAMLKRAVDKTDFVHIDSIQSRIEEARNSSTTKRDYELERITKDRDEISKILRDFETHSGIDLRAARWDKDIPKEIGKTVKFIQSGGVASLKTQLFELEKTAKKVLNKITEGLQLAIGKETTDEPDNR